MQQCNYVAKSRNNWLFKSAARELASRNINVNCIAPGYINTDMTKVLSDKIKDEVVKNIPMRKIGEARSS